MICLNRIAPPRIIARSYIAAFVKVFVLAAFLVAAVQSSASAALTITVVNRTAYTITAAYCTTSGTKTWGPNILRYKIGSGQKGNFTLKRDARKWDFKFVLSDGRVHTKYGLDIVKVSTLYVGG